MFKLSKGNVCMIKYAPEAYGELNGWVVKLRLGSLYHNVESWYTEEQTPNIFSEAMFPIPENWLWKFETQSNP